MAQKIPEKYDGDIPEGRAFEAKTGRSQDLLLRLHGFVIHSRPANGPNLWVRADGTYTEAEALELCKRNRK